MNTRNICFFFCGEIRININIFWLKKSPYLELFLEIENYLMTYGTVHSDQSLDSR